MKALFLAVVVILSCLSVGTAQGTAKIMLYSDEIGTECNIIDNSPGVISIYMYAEHAEGVFGVQFRAPLPECWTGAVWLGDIVDVNKVPMGNTQIDMGLTVATVAGGSCPDPEDQHHAFLGIMNFMVQGTGESCCVYPVLKAADLHPEFPGPIGVTCDSQLLGVEAGYAVINPDMSCQCTQPLPVEETTWGRIKALYK
jgi:hypothetical protein